MTMTPKSTGCTSFGQYSLYSISAHRADICAHCVDSAMPKDLLVLRSTAELHVLVVICAEVLGMTIVELSRSLALTDILTIRPQCIYMYVV